MTNFIAKIDAAVACLDSLSSRLDNCERMDAQARIDAEKKKRDPTDEYLEERRFDPESGGYEDSERSDAGERTIKKAAYQQKIKEGVWEVEYEPDSHGRATIIKKRTGERETLRVVD